MSVPHLVLDRDGTTSTHDIPEGLVRIGRSPLNTIQVDEPSVSRLHCFLSRAGGEVRLFDAGSENGTRLGRDGVDGVLLADGDAFRIGRVLATFRSGAPDASAASPPRTPRAIVAAAVAGAGLLLSIPFLAAGRDDVATPEPVEAASAAAPVAVAPVEPMEEEVPEAPVEPSLAERIEQLEGRLAEMAIGRDERAGEDRRALEAALARTGALEAELRLLREENARLEAANRSLAARTEDARREAESARQEAEAIRTAAARKPAEPPASGAVRAQEPPVFAETESQAIERGAVWLASAQLSGGAWGLEPGQPADLGTTCLATLALMDVVAIDPAGSELGRRLQRPVEAGLREVLEAIGRWNGRSSRTSQLEMELGAGIHESLALWTLVRAHEAADDSGRRRIRPGLDRAADLVSKTLEGGRSQALGDSLAIARHAIDLARSRQLAPATHRSSGATQRSALLFPADPASILRSGSVAGEQYLRVALSVAAARESPQNRTEALMRARATLISIQDREGSWTGHGCLDSRTVCTSAALVAIAETGRVR